MSIRVTCEKCGVVLKVKDELAGTKGKCPACKGTLNVPTLEQAAQAAPIAATETAAAAGDTGALKIPSAKPKAAKVAEAPLPGDEAAPLPEANGTAAKHATPEKKRELPLPPPVARMPPVSPGESKTDDLVSPEPEAKPKAELKYKGPKLPPVPEETSPPAQKPATAAELKPVQEAKPAPSTDAPKGGANAGGGDFDLDSFLMEGPKPKAPPPVPENTAGKSGTAPRPGSGRKLSMSDDETNVSGPSETLAPPNKGRFSSGESAMSALSGGGGATASSAKDLLARASQEGRARASQMPEDERERFDYAGAAKVVFREYGYHVFGTIALCAFLFFSMDYMMSDADDLPQLAPVYGRLTVKKQPVEGVLVYFTPVGSKDAKDSGKQQVKKGSVRPAAGVTDKDGKFELFYKEGVAGGVVGQNRVWIDPQSSENYKKIPEPYTGVGTSGDIREIKATGGEENIEL